MRARGVGSTCQLATRVRVTAFALGAAATLGLSGCGPSKGPAALDPSVGVHPALPPKPPHTLRKIVAVQPVRCRLGFAAPADYDGDGAVDLGAKNDVGRWTWDVHANGFENGLWENTLRGYGDGGLLPLPADYDGDRKADRGYFLRGSPCEGKKTGCWCIEFSASAGRACYPVFADLPGSTPVPADYDGDGKTDLATFDATGAWRIDFSENGFGGVLDLNVFLPVSVGAVPVPADYDGDGSADLAVKDPSGRWFVDYAHDGHGVATHPGISASPAMAHAVTPARPLDFGAWNETLSGFGGADSHPVPADYDGDGKADLAVKNDRGEWHIATAANRFGSPFTDLSKYGGAEFHPVPADYDGDGKADLSERWDYGDWYVDFAKNGFGTWDAMWNPDRIVLGPGEALTSDDVRAFDAKWMNASEIQFLLNDAQGTFGLTNGSYSHGYTARELAAWGYTDRMSALAGMVDLTGDTKYLAHLRDLTNIILAGRDDHRSDSAALLDPFRGRIMPAWGEANIGNAWNHTSSVLMAGLYEYPMAAFARIVLESNDPALLAEYGPDAKAAVNAIIETFTAFTSSVPGFQPEFVTGLSQPGDVSENYWTLPAKTGVLQSANACALAATTGYAAWKAAFGEERTQEQIDKDRDDCVKVGKLAGRPIPHNQYHAFVMALIELSRAIDTDAFKQGADSSRIGYLNVLSRQVLPLVIARAQHYFRHRMRKECSGATRCLVWKYADYDSDDSASDLGHANLDMRFLGLLWRDQGRLDSLLSATASNVRVDLTPDDLASLRNTFLGRVSKGGHLAEGLLGNAANPIDHRDGACDGWVNFAKLDGQCFDKCATPLLGLYLEASASTYNEPVIQPHISPGAHEALLAMKRYRSLTPGGP